MIPKLTRILGGFSLAIAIPLGLFAGYLAVGGSWGREWVKTQLTVLRSDAVVVLKIDGTGCEQVGVWDASTSTCTLTDDLQMEGTIRVADDGLTLDGDGHQLRGDAGIGPAILLAGVSGVTVRDVAVFGYSEGLLLYGARGALITSSEFRGVAGHAIRVMGDSRYNRIFDNEVRDTELHGVAMWMSHGNVVAGNLFVGTRDAVRLQSSQGNTVIFNRTVGSLIEGVDLHLADNTTILGNDLIEPVAAHILDDAIVGANTFGIRGVGNYFLRYDEDVEGCVDADADEICDAPFEFFGYRAPSPSLSRFTTDGDWSEANVWPVVLGRLASDGSPEVVCSGCHDLGNGEDAGIGPSLAGILGRPIGDAEDFEYSEALRRMEGAWTEERLAAFIGNPEAFAPGTSMAFPGIPDSMVVARLVDYFRSF